MSFRLLLFLLSIVSSGGGQQGETVSSIIYSVIQYFSVFPQYVLQPLFVKCIHQTTHLLLVT